MAFSAHAYDASGPAGAFMPANVSAPFFVMGSDCSFLGGFPTMAAAESAAALLGAYTRPSTAAGTFTGFTCVGAATSA